MEEKKITVNGVNINYVVHGSGSKNILCLPGSLGTWETDFKPILPSFSASRYTVVVWDPPGHGKSRPPDRVYHRFYNLDQAHLCAELMKNLELTPFSVLGWSEGGRTAFHLAYEYPDLVEKLVEWGATNKIDSEMSDFFQMVKNPRDWSPDALKPLEKIYGLDYVCKTWTALVDFYTGVAKGNQKLACYDIIGKINQPMLVIHMGKDNVASSTEKIAKEIVKTAKRARLVIQPKGKHNVHLQYTEWFMKVVEEFINCG